MFFSYNRSSSKSLISLDLSSFSLPPARPAPLHPAHYVCPSSFCWMRIMWPPTLQCCAHTCAQTLLGGLEGAEITWWLPTPSRAAPHGVATNKLTTHKNTRKHTYTRMHMHTHTHARTRAHASPAIHPEVKRNKPRTRCNVHPILAFSALLICLLLSALTFGVISPAQSTWPAVPHHSGHQLHQLFDPGSTLDPIPLRNQMQASTHLEQSYLGLWFRAISFFAVGACDMRWSGFWSLTKAFLLPEQTRPDQSVHGLPVRQVPRPDPSPTFHSVPHFFTLHPLSLSLTASQFTP